MANNGLVSGERYGKLVIDEGALDIVRFLRMSKNDFPQSGTIRT